MNLLFNNIGQVVLYFVNLPCCFLCLWWSSHEWDLFTLTKWTVLSQLMLRYPDNSIKLQAQRKYSNRTHGQSQDTNGNQGENHTTGKMMLAHTLYSNVNTQTNGNQGENHTTGKMMQARWTAMWTHTQMEIKEKTTRCGRQCRHDVQQCEHTDKWKSRRKPQDGEDDAGTDNEQQCEHARHNHKQKSRRKPWDGEDDARTDTVQQCEPTDKRKSRRKPQDGEDDAGTYTVQQCEPTDKRKSRRKPWDGEDKAGTNNGTNDEQKCEHTQIHKRKSRRKSGDGEDDASTNDEQQCEHTVTRHKQKSRRKLQNGEEELSDSFPSQPQCIDKIPVKSTAAYI